VGSFAGASLLLSYTALRRNSPQVKAIAVEPEGQPQFYDVIRALGNDVQHIKKFSDAAATEIAALYAREGCAADVILIDGDHTYEGVYRDIECYLPLLKTGGIVIFHDFLPPLSRENTAAIFYHHGNKEPGIRRACQELMEQRYGCDVIEMPLLYPTDPTQTQPQLPIIPGVMSTIRVYRKR
jgi:predicted O-methyltransferase YrrM